MDENYPDVDQLIAATKRVVALIEARARLAHPERHAAVDAVRERGQAVVAVTVTLEGEAVSVRASICRTSDGRELFSQVVDSTPVGG